MLELLTSQPIDPTPEVPRTATEAIVWLGGVIIIGLLATVRALWKDNQAYRAGEKALRESYASQQEKQLREMLQVGIEARNQIAESEGTMAEAAKAVEAATIMMHNIQGRGFPVETITEINLALRDLRNIREKELHELQRRRSS